MALYEVKFAVFINRYMKQDIPTPTNNFQYLIFVIAIVFFALFGFLKEANVTINYNDNRQYFINEEYTPPLNGGRIPIPAEKPSGITNR